MNVISRLPVDTGDNTGRPRVFLRKITWLRSLAVAGAVSVLMSPGDVGAADQNRNAKPLEVLWFHELQTGTVLPPCKGTPAVGQDGTVYVSTNNFLYAIATDGTEKWKFKTGDPFSSDVALDDQANVYITANSSVCALAPGGLLKWKIPGPEKWLAAAVAVGDDSSIYFMNAYHLCAANSDGKL